MESKKNKRSDNRNKYTGLKNSKSVSAYVRTKPLDSTKNNDSSKHSSETKSYSANKPAAEKKFKRYSAAKPSDIEKPYTSQKSLVEAKRYPAIKPSAASTSYSRTKPSAASTSYSRSKPSAASTSYSRTKPSAVKKLNPGKKSFIGNKAHFESKSKSESKPYIKPDSPVITILNDEPDDLNESLIMEGRKAVLEVLNNEKPVDRILLRKEADKPVEGTLRVIAAKARERGIVVQEVSRFKLDEISETGHHQGVIALCPAVDYVEISDMLNAAKEKGEPPFIILLDGVTDPHNLGAVIRTAEAGGAHGIVIPKRRAVGLTGTVAKTSAGAIAHLPVARVTNITQALKELKAAGLWVVCGDMAGQSMYKSDLTGPIALVVGAEGVGVSRLAREQSDYIVSIPMLGKIASLNVSVAAGVLIYEIVRRRSR